MKLLLISIIFLLSGCHENSTKENTMQGKINLKISQSASKFIEENKKFKVTTRPPGINFYVARWNTSDQKTVRIENERYSFDVENTLSVTAVDDPHSQKEGIVQFSINAGISSSDLIDHDEARKKFFLILANIRKAGWKKFINEGDPRLKGRDMLNFMLSDAPVISLDADYEPTFEEWMRIPNQSSWRFYANNVYLSVDFSREPTLVDPRKPGAYLVSFKVESENEHYRNYVEPDDRDNWKSALQAQLNILPPMRERAEAALRAKGIKIDEGYQDPPKPNLLK